MISRLVIFFIILFVCYLKYPLTLCLSSDPTFMIGEVEVYTSFFVFYFLCEMLYFFRVKLLQYKNKKNIDTVFGSLQFAVESMITEDYKAVNKHLDKAEKIVGEDTVLLNWMRGCERLYSKNFHEAKSKFYQIAYTKNSILGGYSLYKLAEREGHSKDAYESLKQITTNVQNTPDYILKNLIKFQFLNKDFKSARDNINKIKNKRLLGISYYLEDASKLDNLKIAFKYVKNIPDITIAYAKKLVFLKNYKAAKNVIMESWGQSYHPLLFKYWVLVNKQNEIDTAKKFVKKPSFDGYSEFAALLYDNEMFALSYKYFKEAFVIHPTKKGLFFINDLRKKLEKHEDNIMLEENVVDENLIFEDPSWNCESCNNHLENWSAVCPNCNALDSVHWVFKNEKRNFAQNNQDVLLLEKDH